MTYINYENHKIQEQEQCSCEPRGEYGYCWCFSSEDFCKLHGIEKKDKALDKADDEN